MNSITLKPARNGLIVPNLNNRLKPLSEDGETVPNSRYWQRRIKDGDVVIVTKVASKSKATQTSKETK